MGTVCLLLNGESRLISRRESFCGVFRSLRDISVEEEITIAYINLLQPCKQRRAELLEKYDIDQCMCSACKQQWQLRRKSDNRRLSLAKRLTVEDDDLDASGYDDGYIEETLEMLDAERLQREKLRMLARFAEAEGKRAQLTGSYERAEELASRVLKEMEDGDYEDGGDNELVKRMTEILSYISDTGVAANGAISRWTTSTV